ncbi:MAG: hypothetical protein ACXV5H_08255 [Halobacteriota archaeon]
MLYLARYIRKKIQVSAFNALLHLTHEVYKRIQVSAFNAFASLFGNEIVLLHTNTSYYVYLFWKVLVKLNLKGIRCVYVRDEASFKKYLPRARVVFEWGGLCRKYDMRGKTYFTNVDFTKDQQYALMQEVGVTNMANYAYLDVDKIYGLTTPLIAKPIAGMRTSDIHLLMSELDIADFLEKHDLAKYIFTEYVKYGEYEVKWRINTVSDKILWYYMTKRESEGYNTPGYKRKRRDALHREKPTPAVTTAVEKIATYFANRNNVNFLGFDVLTDKTFQDFAILEFNTKFVAMYTAEWLDAEQNIAERLAEYLSDAFNANI